MSPVDGSEQKIQYRFKRVIFSKSRVYSKPKIFLAFLLKSRSMIIISNKFATFEALFGG